MRVHSKLVFELDIAKNLDAAAVAADKTVSAEQIGRDGFAGGKRIELFDVDDGVFDGERVVKAALGHAAMQRHLAAFKAATTRIAAARLLSLVAGSGRFAELRAHAAADAHLAMARAARGPQIREADAGLAFSRFFFRPGHISPPHQ